MYSVKEIFYSLQGEGTHTGRPAVFCRFSGCNLWNGQKKEKSTAVCQFCDTDFVGTDGINGGKYQTARALVDVIISIWPTSHHGERFIVLTGGEPLLQVDADLIDILHNEHFFIAVETNGTILPPPGVDWICMSPKSGSNIAILSGSELKVVFPQKDLNPLDYEHYSFDHFLIQPMDGAEAARNRTMAVEFCLANPRWRLSLQTHKLLGIL